MNDSTDSERLSALAVNLMPGIGPLLQKRLLEHFGSPAAVLQANSEQLAVVPGIGKKLLDKLRDVNYCDQARREWDDCQQHGIDVLLHSADGYPPALREIPDPPLLLYCQGELRESDQLAVAIVGSRNCSLYGQRWAERIAAGLSRAGVTVTSGLARGIDSFAHRAALTAGGRTVAVNASGLLKIYPAEHRQLAAEITRQGALLSESPLLMQPKPGLFPQRNRVVSGISLAVVVIEASRTSGTLHTARHAMEQGREVFAVPGQLDSRNSEGCHALIRDGAKLIRGVDDILEDLGPLMQPVKVPQHSEQSLKSVEKTSATKAEVSPIEIRTPRELKLTDQQTQILNRISDIPVSIDTIIEDSKIEPSRVLSTITILEMKRVIRRLPGNLLQRIPQ